MWVLPFDTKFELANRKRKEVFNRNSNEITTSELKKM